MYKENNDEVVKGFQNDVKRRDFKCRPHLTLFVADRSSVWSLLQQNTWFVDRICSGCYCLVLCHGPPTKHHFHTEYYYSVYHTAVVVLL